MPRNARIDVGGEIYHVLNRANGRLQIFTEPKDYQLFLELLLEAQELTGMRILAYTLMPNHWHLILQPALDGDLGIFMHRLTNSHTRKMHAETGTNGSGHLYQGRYKSFLVDTDAYLLTLIKYVERNPVRARLVTLAELWQWGSVWARVFGTQKQKKLLAGLPVSLPDKYLEWVNAFEKEESLLSIRTSVNKGVPYGREQWKTKMIAKFHLESTMRLPGRPKKDLG